MPKLPDDSFAKVLRNLREARGVTRDALAEALGVQRRRIRDIERGRLPPLSDERIGKAAFVLGIPPTPLMLAAQATRSAMVAPCP